MKRKSITYYIDNNGDNPVSMFLDSLSAKQQAKFMRVLQNIQTYGLISVIPHLKKLQNTPFWEIRILGSDNMRIIYLLLDTTSILLLHGFIKKTNKTPKRELSIAYSRLNDWKINKNGT